MAGALELSARRAGPPGDANAEGVLIFRQMLLPISETFVTAQVSALTRYRPRYAGFQAAMPSLPLPDDAIYLTNLRRPFSRLRKAVYDFIPVAPSFHKRICDFRPALVHAHFGQDGAAALPLLRRLDVPLIVTLHGGGGQVADSITARSLRGRLYLARRSKLWKRATTFICVSECVARAALARGFPSDKLVLHYIGVDRKRFAPGRGQREPIALFVGRLVEQKGCEFVLRAMRRVAAEVPGVRTVVIGDGPLRAQLQQCARALDLDCTFLGTCDNDTVRDWMARARMVCVPSITTADGTTEALGIVSLEAQASGTPVVGFRTGGIPEAIAEGSTGMLAPPGDVASLAAAMQRYFTDEALWRAASSRAPDWVAQRFDLASQTRELEGIYDRACGAKG